MLEAGIGQGVTHALTRRGVSDAVGIAHPKGNRSDNLAAMTLRFEIPGREALDLRHALFDVNGTLTNRGALLEDVIPLVAQLAFEVSVAHEQWLDEVGRDSGGR